MTKLPDHPDWAALGEAMPEYGKHLPWGPFYGVWVKKGMPADVVAKLKDSFSKAADDPKFKEFVVKNELLPMNLTGADALKFANDFIPRRPGCCSMAFRSRPAGVRNPTAVGVAGPGGHESRTIFVNRITTARICQ